MICHEALLLMCDILPSGAAWLLLVISQSRNKD
jgi:hypothetical protein